MSPSSKSAWQGTRLPAVVAAVPEDELLEAAGVAVTAVEVKVVPDYIVPMLALRLKALTLR